MSTLLNSHQGLHLGVLSIIAPLSNTKLSAVLANINNALIPPLQLLNSMTPRVITIGSIVVANLDSGQKKIPYPINGTSIPSFVTGSITFPLIGGGTIVLTPGTNISMPAIGASKFLKVGVSLNDSGNITLQFGTAGISIATATMPAQLSPAAIDIGYIVISTDISNNVNLITNGSIYQYTGSIAKNAASVPAASEIVDGYVTITTQNFAGNKTFLGTTTINNNLTVTGNINNNINSLMQPLVASGPINPFQYSFLGGSWAIGANAPFAGAVVMSSSEVFLIPGMPHTANLTKFIRYDFKNHIIGSGAYNIPCPGGYAVFSGGVLLPNGKIFCSPSSSGTWPVVFNPSNNSFEGPVSPGSTMYGAYRGAVLLPNGKVLCVPSYYTGTLTIYNSITNAFEAGPAGPGNAAFAGGVLMPNGKVLCVPCNASSTKYIYNPTTNNWENGPSVPSGGYYGFNNGVLLPNGKVLVSPRSFVGNQLLYNPITNLWENTGDTASLYGKYGVVLLPNGKAYLIPGGATTNTRSVYNPTTNLWESGGLVSIANSWSGGVLLPDGRIFCAPFNASNPLIITPASVEWPLGQWMLNPLFSNAVGAG